MWDSLITHSNWKKKTEQWAYMYMSDLIKRHMFIKFRGVGRLLSVNLPMKRSNDREFIALNLNIRDIYFNPPIISESLPIKKVYPTLPERVATTVQST